MNHYFNCTIFREEQTRFRGRVNEIINFLDVQTKDFQQYQLTLDDEAFGFGEAEEVAQTE